MLGVELSIAVETAGEIMDVYRFGLADPGNPLKTDLVAGIVEFHIADQGDEPLRSACLTSGLASSGVKASGFSTIRCLPARSASATISPWS